MSKSDKVVAFSEFLKEEGYAPKIDGDDDIVFKVEGKTYLIIFDDNDEEFFRIIFPGFWKIESPDERLKVERAALEATAETKVAKVYPNRDNTWASVEIFSSSIDNSKLVFSRSMRALKAAVGTFAEKMQE